MYYKTLGQRARRVTPGSFQVVVEATASYDWLVQFVEPMADRVVLAHPGKLRVIAESTRKSDKLDAKVLAEFLAFDMIPEAYRPTPRQREHRQWVRHRQYLRVRVASIPNRWLSVLFRRPALESTRSGNPQRQDARRGSPSASGSGNVRESVRPCDAG